jgi:hypothetical protein
VGVNATCNLVVIGLGCRSRGWKSNIGVLVRVLSEMQTALFFFKVGLGFELRAPLCYFLIVSLLDGKVEEFSGALLQGHKTHSSGLYHMT